MEEKPVIDTETTAESSSEQDNVEKHEENQRFQHEEKETILEVTELSIEHKKNINEDTMGEQMNQDDKPSKTNDLVIQLHENIEENSSFPIDNIKPIDEFKQPTEIDLTEIEIDILNKDVSDSFKPQNTDPNDFDPLEVENEIVIENVLTEVVDENMQLQKMNEVDYQTPDDEEDVEPAQLTNIYNHNLAVIDKYCSDSDENILHPEATSLSNPTEDDCKQSAENYASADLEILETNFEIVTENEGYISRDDVCSEECRSATITETPEEHLTIYAQDCADEAVNLMSAEELPFPTQNVEEFVAGNDNENVDICVEILSESPQNLDKIWSEKEEQFAQLNDYPNIHEQLDLISSVPDAAIKDECYSGNGSQSHEHILESSEIKDPISENLISVLNVVQEEHFPVIHDEAEIDNRVEQHVNPVYVEPTNVASITQNADSEVNPHVIYGKGVEVFASPIDSLASEIEAKHIIEKAVIMNVHNEVNLTRLPSEHALLSNEPQHASAIETVIKNSSWAEIEIFPTILTADATDELQEEADTMEGNITSKKCKINEHSRDDDYEIESSVYQPIDDEDKENRTSSPCTEIPESISSYIKYKDYPPEEAELNELEPEEMDFDTKYARFVGKVLPGHEIYYQSKATPNKTVTLPKGGTLDRYAVPISGTSPLWEVPTNVMRAKSATLGAHRQRRLEPKPSVNDDYLYPDSVTPSKVEKTLVQEKNDEDERNQYDVPFMDDEAFVPRRHRSYAETNEGIADSEESFDSDYSDSNQLLGADHLAKLDDMSSHSGLNLKAMGPKQVNEEGSRWSFGFSICGCLRRQK